MSVSVPTFTVHPGVACPPSPLMIIHNDIDADEDDDNEEDDDEPSVPLEQYRAWLGKFQLNQCRCFCCRINTSAGLNSQV